jgi:citronellol/citronellal dehydrogenase
VELDGKVALVTGASRGVGAATAKVLAAAGCRVACAARSTAAQPQPIPGTLDEIVAAIVDAGGEAVAVPTNLAVEADVAAMVEATVARFGALDVLVNNAAITFPGDLDIEMKRFDLVMAVDLRAPFVATRAAIPHMAGRGGGAVLNLSSAAALFPYEGLMAYGMAKIALERMTVDAARQLAGRNIAVNCFRIDVPVASEGFVANTPGLSREGWEPSEVAAEGILWMLRQPMPYSGQVESMYELRRREGIMASRAGGEWPEVPPTTFQTGLG